MTRSHLLYFMAIATLGAVALFADPVPLIVHDTTGKVLTPLVADATSNKTIAVFEIPMGVEIYVSNTPGTGSSVQQNYPRDFELKIYRQTTSAAQSSVALADKVYWYHSPDAVGEDDQVIPLGFPKGYFAGGQTDGGPGGANKTLYKIDHNLYDSLGEHRPATYIFSGVVLYVETAGTNFELLKDCHAMYCRYTASGSEVIDSADDARKWTPIIPTQWVSEYPAFIE